MSDISFLHPALVDKLKAHELLIGARRDLPTADKVTSCEVSVGLSLWLALCEPRYCGLWARGELAERDLVPDLFFLQSGSLKFQLTSGLLTEDAVCPLMRDPDRTRHTDEPTESLELHVRSYGQDNLLAHRLTEQIVAWDKSGRLGSQRLCIRAYPSDAGYRARENEVVVGRRWTRLVLEWE